MKTKQKEFSFELAFVPLTPFPCFVFFLACAWTYIASEDLAFVGRMRYPPPPATSTHKYRTQYGQFSPPLNYSSFDVLPLSLRCDSMLSRRSWTPRDNSSELSEFFFRLEGSEYNIVSTVVLSDSIISFSRSASITEYNALFTRWRNSYELHPVRAGARGGALSRSGFPAGAP